VQFAAAAGQPLGAVMPALQLAALGRRWYRGRLDPEWRPRSGEASQALLAATGLTGAFWQLAG
jgi:hypothetical protein